LLKLLFLSSDYSLIISLSIAVKLANIEVLSYSHESFFTLQIITTNITIQSFMMDWFKNLFVLFLKVVLSSHYTK